MRKDIALPVLALAGGGACLALRRWQLAAALDPETELFRSVPATPVLIGVLALLALLFLVLIQGGGKPEDYPAAFRCPSSLYMTLVTAGSLLLLAAAALGTLGFFRAFQLWRDGLGQGLPVMELLAAVLCIPSAAALMILGRGHYRGRPARLLSRPDHPARLRRPCPGWWGSIRVLPTRWCCGSQI